LIEGLGFGAIEEAIADLPETTDNESACRSYADAVITNDPEFLELTIDGATIKERFAVLEIATIPLIGPNLRLAPAADPNDRNFAISFVRDTVEEQQALAAWILAPKRGTPPPVTLRSATRMTIARRFQRVRIDGKIRRPARSPTGTSASRSRWRRSPNLCGFYCPVEPSGPLIEAEKARFATRVWF
jgi:diacylglycerol kinase (ATP)